MRCLYCGKELALLKRWTGGGEFCSDAHRQRYQEEYNQLALKRLMQSQPESNPELKPDPKPPKHSRLDEPRKSAHPEPTRRESAIERVETRPEPVTPRDEPRVDVQP